MREQNWFRKKSLFVEVLTILQKMFKKKNNEKSRVADDLERQQTERTLSKCSKCRYVDHQISKFPKPPEDNGKELETVHFNERDDCAFQKESENGDNDNDQNKYASMAQMYSNDNSSSRDFGDSSQLTDWIFD